ncbi:hypothetical protein PAHAL_4G163400 [Panicum hallii]|uniref:Uncharacterized protein n=1 Tax=Panicum hallii TaxID=206008 RepID=A0A2T8JD41_9POAL|nr:uncharacterized protein LOC112891022 [Panicum hallii]PVH47843.1 hypothetical protein PAHAL_4G163400 [Panicum hallii]
MEAAHGGGSAGGGSRQGLRVGLGTGLPCARAASALGRLQVCGLASDARALLGGRMRLRPASAPGRAARGGSGRAWWPAHVGRAAMPGEDVTRADLSCSPLTTLCLLVKHHHLIPPSIE